MRGTQKYTAHTKLIFILSPAYPLSLPTVSVTLPSSADYQHFFLARTTDKGSTICGFTDRSHNYTAKAPDLLGEADTFKAAHPTRLAGISLYVYGVFSEFIHV